MAQDIAEAIHLGEMAIALMQRYQSHQPHSETALDALRSAAWRLADAAGILSETIGSAELIGTGITEPTGRGYTLPRRAEGY